MGRSLAVVIALAIAAMAVCPPMVAAPPPDEKPPGLTPRVFAPAAATTGIIHSRLAISPDGREMFWSVVDTTTFETRLVGIRKVGNTWTRPRPAPFAPSSSAQSPLFSPDGRRLHFTVRGEKGWATKFVEKLASGWSAPAAGRAPLDCSSSFTRTGRVYLSSEMKTKTWGTGIFSARMTQDGYDDLAPLDSTINVPHAIDYTPWISPDESFLLFSSNRPHVGDREDMHVFVSFRAADGTWSAPRRVSDIPARFPSLSPDGRYLFFCGDDGNFYWADVRLIDTLRPVRDAGPQEGC
jgi:hypothetical protein